MRTPIFQIDAFTSRRFAGNPAAVMPMDVFPADAVLQAIAAENNLAETAFLVPKGDDYHLRWFTPTIEVPLCGHATLASAAVVMERLEPQRRRVVFQSASGPLTVSRTDAGYVMDFPARVAEPVIPPPELIEALGVAPVEVLAHSRDYLALLESAVILRKLAPDMAAIARIERRRRDRHRARRWRRLRFHQSILCSGDRHPGRCRHRGRSLHPDTLLGQKAQQGRVSRFPSIAPRRGDHLQARRRSCRASRYRSFLPGRSRRDLTTRDINPALPPYWRGTRSRSAPRPSRGLKSRWNAPDKAV